MFIQNVGGADMVICPQCGFEYNHFEAIMYRYNNDSYEIVEEKAITCGGHVHDRKLKEKSHYRGDQVWIFFRCENQHTWVLQFHFHKGNTYVHTVILEKAEPRNHKQEYQEYLKSEKWKKLAAKKRKQADNKCQLCNNNKNTLHVHHRTYENLYKEKLKDLIVLCDKCHTKFHDIMEGENEK